MAALPVEILSEIHLGVLTSLVPALIAWLLGFGFNYSTDITVPGPGAGGPVVVITGPNGGLFALADPRSRGVQPTPAHDRPPGRAD